MNFFTMHRPLGKAGGTQEQVEALRLLGTPQFPRACFSSVEYDAAELKLQMTQNTQVDDERMMRLRDALGNTCTVELVIVIAAYKMVSRFLIASKVGPENHPPA